MITKTMVAISALISLVYVIADEIAVNYMLQAANGAAVAGAAARPVVNLSEARREAAAALKDLQAKKPEAGSRTDCREQAWPYYSGACIALPQNRQVRILRSEPRREATAEAGNLRQAANF